MKKLLDIMAALRNPETGCPWDIKQTFKTVVPYTLEEAYEVADAIENGDMDELKSELGDLLFQVVFYAQMAKEQGDFDFNDVVDAVSDKLINRHPHVFAGVECKDEKILHEAWEKSKANERDTQSSENKASILDGVARALPALKRAQKLQKRAAREGFDWPDIEPVLAKIEEEVGELRSAIKEDSTEAVFEESGDVLFSCVNLLRHLNVDAEESLRGCNQKFEKRFGYIERSLIQQDRSFQECSLDELEGLWQKAKNEA
ncbi:MAG: nucleoside triphosphate pyrophosphohydrolase [endosymbiont of Galathealinum brachiosum]|uniref:Nucleoside triphosphate pyrophosphohydrolase n=1 Tax=endosymbiont of Galathealinum brachiosum TaxID=2200906 RepID=A0A370DFS5_9GAMM|nr:MAG: nucleoside triphosphate pyrophosphohydrolase [endosymbiont of Galathealinum brachiosum]